MPSRMDDCKSTDQVWTLEELVRLLDPENGRSGWMKYRIGIWAGAGLLVARLLGTLCLQHHASGHDLCRPDCGSRRIDLPRCAG